MCADVLLIHRRDAFRASKAVQRSVQEKPKIRILRSHVVSEVLDVRAERVTGLRLKDIRSGDTPTVEVDALFVAIGHTPMTDLFKGQLEVHANGYLKREPGSLGPAERAELIDVFAVLRDQNRSAAILLCSSPLSNVHSLFLWTAISCAYRQLHRFAFDY